MSRSGAPPNPYSGARVGVATRHQRLPSKRMTIPCGPASQTSEAEVPHSVSCIESNGVVRQRLWAVHSSVVWPRCGGSRRNKAAASHRSPPTGRSSPARRSTRPPRRCSRPLPRRRRAGRPPPCRAVVPPSRAIDRPSERAHGRQRSRCRRSASPRCRRARPTTPTAWSTIFARPSGRRRRSRRSTRSPAHPDVAWLDGKILWGNAPAAQFSGGKNVTQP